MNQKFIRRINLSDFQDGDSHDVLRREWLLTNGLGGYASSTISGMVSRRYHGLLIAALPAPLGRVVMLNHLAEYLKLPNGSCVQIGGEEPSNNSTLDRHYISEFRLEFGLPYWRYQIEDYIIEKCILLVHEQNTVHVTYRLESSHDAVVLELRPSVHFRRHEQEVSEAQHEEYTLTAQGGHYVITTIEPYYPLHLYVHTTKTTFIHEGGTTREIVYQREAERGYHSHGMLWSPGIFSIELRQGRTATLVASAESWNKVLALTPQDAYVSEIERRQRLIAQAHPSAHEGEAAELVLATDQFIIRPIGRVEDTTRARASGDEIRTVIAGYHWFTDWGRDTMISLEGLTLCTGRHMEARWILRTFAHYIRNGLIPNLFPEGETEGLYHTADATLWFFYAIEQYVKITGDQTTLQLLLPQLRDVIEYHLRGTDFGIGMDANDGLLRQGAKGYQLTWMDAKVGDWVVTPRRGKAVEINALWYNALKLLEGWLRTEEGDAAATPYAEHAQRVWESFNKRFWSKERGYLLDVVDGENGDDASCRPNQILAISLHHAVLDSAYWKTVLDHVREELLTPVGLRSLSRTHSDYKARYFGDLRSRDAAYHQGTVWAWLIGPFIDAWLKVNPEDRKGARQWLKGIIAHLDEACIGSISEVFDAEAPFTARGCIAQAWSVAEVLRCWVKTQD